MTETAKKTPEEELIGKANAGEGAGAEEGASGAGAGGETETEEQKLIRELRARVDESESKAKKFEEERDSERLQKNTLRTQAKTAVEKQIEAQETSIKNAVEGAKSEFNSAKREYRDAVDSGDTEKMLDAQTKLNDAQFKLRGVEWQESQFKDWKEKTAGRVAVSTTESRFTPKEQAWIDKNPQFNNDPVFRGVIYAAHETAMQKGIEVDSDDYFDHVNEARDQYLNKTAREKTNDDPAPREENKETNTTKTTPPAKKNEKQNTAAPPNGSSGNSSGGSKKSTITMTPEMRRGAQITFPEEYAKDPKAAEEKYAKYQLEIADKKSKGEL